MFRILLMAFAALLLHSTVGGAQTGKDARALPNVTPPSPTAQRPPRIGSPAEEMLHRALIRHAEEEHKEMLERADETAELADQLHSAFQTAQTLGRQELKKLERIEKLARKIRGNAGGDDDKLALKETPQHLGDALKQLSEISEELKKSVSKTSRLVVSAAVIERSNELIELTRFIRASVKK